MKYPNASSPPSFQSRSSVDGEDEQKWGPTQQWVTPLLNLHLRQKHCLDFRTQKSVQFVRSIHQLIFPSSGAAYDKGYVAIYNADPPPLPQHFFPEKRPSSFSYTVTVKTKHTHARTHTHTHTHTMDDGRDKQGTEKGGLDVLDLVRCKAEQKQ